MEFAVMLRLMDRRGWDKGSVAGERVLGGLAIRRRNFVSINYIH
jgi:hypothetical protein